MPNLKQEAQAYEPSTTKTVAELDKISVEVEIVEKDFTNSQGEDYKAKVVTIDDVDYRLPNSVLGHIKTLLNNMPDLKNVKVIKEGDGKLTKYTTIPMQ